ncbi:MAG: CsgG/HfaB family protein, partial [Bryobacteraceae bacterium]
MRRIQALIVGMLVLAVSVAPLSAQAKRRVAVMNFEYGTVSTTVAQIFGTNVDIGKGIADMLVDRLVNDGTYSVIERKA